MPLTTKIPIAFWGPEPPSHSISCMTVCSPESVVTGSTEGQLIVWQLHTCQDQISRIVPFCMLFAHSSPVVDLTSVWLPNSEIHSAFISLSEEGEICLWNSENGCCLNSRNFNCYFLTVQVMTFRHNSKDKTILAIYGMNYEIIICDPLSFEQIFILKQTPVNMSLVMYAHMSFDTLLAVTSQNTLKKWYMSISFSKHSKVEVCYESANIPLDITDQLVLFAKNPFQHKEHLIIAKSRWMIYDSYTNSFIFISIIKPTSFFSYGKFIDQRTLMIAEKFGKIRIHHLSSTVSEQYPQKFSLTEHILVQFVDNEIFTSPSQCLLLGTDISADHYAVRSGADGSLSIWRSPVLTEVAVKEIVSQFRSIYTVPLLDKVTLKDIWEHYKPLGPVDFIDNDGSSIANTSSSIYLADLAYMIVGRANGEIIILSAIQAACIQLLANNVDAVSDHMEYATLKGHIGPVTCLSYPFQHDSSFPAHYLLSGGTDFTVRIWNLTNCEEKCIVTRHSSPISRIKTFPFCAMNNVHYVASVALDNSVCLINIDKCSLVFTANLHTSIISDIKFKPLENIFLTSCYDGSVYIWNVITGALERRYTGKAALDIMKAFNEDSSLPLARPYEKPPCWKISFHSSATTNRSHFSSVNTYYQQKSSGSHNFNLLYHPQRSFHHLRMPGDHSTKFENSTHKTNKRGIFKKIKKMYEKHTSSSHGSTNPHHHHHHHITSPSSFNISESHFTPANLQSRASISRFGSSVAFRNTPGMSQSSNSVSATHPIESGREGCYFLENKTNYVDVFTARTGVCDTDINILIIDCDLLIDRLIILEDYITSTLTEENDTHSSTINSQTNISTTKLEENTIFMHQNTSTHSKNRLRMMKCNKQILSSKLNPAGQSSSQTNDDKFNLPSLELLMLALSYDIPYQDYYKLCFKQHSNNRNELRYTVHLLISCLHVWGVDEDMDSVCADLMKLSKPKRPIRFGTISQGRLMLQLPGWFPNTNDQVEHDSYAMKRFEDSSLSAKNVCGDKDRNTVESTKNERYYAQLKECNMHFQTSPAMTTLHVISLVSITNTLIGMRSTFFDYFLEPSMDDISEIVVELHKTINFDRFSFFPSMMRNTPHDGDSLDTKQHALLMKTGWGLIASLHSSMLPEIICTTAHSFRPPIFHELLYHLFDESTNIQEASLSVLIPELDRMTDESRDDLISIWSRFLPTISQVDQLDFSAASNSQSFISFIIESYAANTSVFKMTDVDAEHLFNHLSTNEAIYVNIGGFFGFLPHDGYQIQLISVFMIALMVCLFPQVYDPLSENSSKFPDRTPLTSDHMYAVAKVLLKIIHSISHLPASNPLKKCAVFLIGRGYQIWQPYIDSNGTILLILGLSASSAVQSKIAKSVLKICSSTRFVDGKIYQQRLMNDFLLRNAHSVCQTALSRIALSSPETFILALRKEFVRGASGGVHSSSVLSSSNINPNITSMMLPFMSTESSKSFHLHHHHSASTINTASTSGLTSGSFLHVNASVSSSNVCSNIQPPVHHTEMLDYLKLEICQIFDVGFISQNYDCIHKLGIEIIETFLHMTDSKSLKDADPLKLPESLSRLNIITSAPVSGRVAAASSSGDIGIFELKNYKCITIHAHTGPVTCISFNDEGKFLASYCHDEAKVCLWQIQFGIVGLLTSPIKLFKHFVLRVPNNASTATLSKTTIRWTNNNNTVRILYGSIGDSSNHSSVDCIEVNL